jgi:DnaJ-class molecular chaperone
MNTWGLPCYECNGRGTVPDEPADPREIKLGVPLPMVPCKVCKGSGRVARFEDRLPQIMKGAKGVTIHV